MRMLHNGSLGIHLREVSLDNRVSLKLILTRWVAGIGILFPSRTRQEAVVAAVEIKNLVPTWGLRAEFLRIGNSGELDRKLLKTAEMMFRFDAGVGAGAIMSTVPSEGTRCFRIAL